MTTGDIKFRALISTLLSVLLLLLVFAGWVTGRVQVDTLLICLFLSTINESILLYIRWSVK